MTTRPQDRRSHQNHQDPFGRYRAMSAPAVVSLVCGVLSAATWLHWLLGILPAIGVVSGWFALLRIREFPEELTGRGLARSGLILSAVFGVLGYGWLTFARVKRAPYGYAELTYEMLQPPPGERLPASVYQWQDKRVFMEGYIKPGRQQTRIKTFILCPVIANCPFCTPNPKPTEVVYVVLEGDLEAQYTTHPKIVGGKFRVDPNAPGGVPYILEADYIK